MYKRLNSSTPFLESLIIYPDSRGAGNWKLFIVVTREFDGRKKRTLNVVIIKSVVFIGVIFPPFKYRYATSGPKPPQTIFFPLRKPKSNA